MKHPALENWVEYELGGDAVGTCKKAEILATYDEIAAVFGPHNGGGDKYKIDVEWTITFTRFSQFLAPATIYNYKDGPNYLKEDGVRPQDRGLMHWHIGGSESDVVGYIASMLLHNARQQAEETAVAAE